MKKSLRQDALAYRKQLPSNQIKVFEREITQSLITLLQTMKPCTVGLFYPTQGEPNILGIVGDVSLEPFVWALPVCSESAAGPVLQFAHYLQGEPLEAGQYNIPVPADKRWVVPDVLLIPCLAFHQAGTRLGYGAGWYDRTLANSAKTPVTVGVAYAKAEVEINFAESHDYLLDYIVTEQAVLACRHS